jgi:hypothetical protein
MYILHELEKKARIYSREEEKTGRSGRANINLACSLHHALLFEVIHFYKVLIQEDTTCHGIHQIAKPGVQCTPCNNSALTLALQIINVRKSSCKENVYD